MSAGGPTPENVERICCVGYEACRGVALSIGELDVPTWQIAPAEVKRRYRMAVRMHLDSEVRPELIHEKWMFLMTRQGWSAGEFNESKRLHPHLVPWDQLPPSIRFQGRLLKSVVTTFEKEWEGA